MYRTLNVTKVPLFVLSRQAAKGTAFTFVNNDILNPVWVGESRAIDPNSSDAIQVPALGSTVISGDIDTYAVSTIAAGVQCFLIPGTGGWSPAPSQVAAQLNALGLAKDSTLAAQTSAGNMTIADDVAVRGVPLLAKSTPIASATSTLLANASFTLGPFTVSQISYEAYFNIGNTSGVPTQPTVIEVELTWTDSVSGQIVQIDTFSWFAGNSQTGQPSIVVGHGPQKGDTLTINVNQSNNGNAQAITSTLTYALLESSRVYDRDDWHSTQTGTLPGFTNTANQTDSHIFASSSVSIAANTTATRIVPLYAATAAWVMLETSSNVGDASVRLEDQTTGVFGNLFVSPGLNYPTVAYFFTDGANGRNQQLVYLSRGQMKMSLHNGNAATKTVSCTIVAAEQPI